MTQMSPKVMRIRRLVSIHASDTTATDGAPRFAVAVYEQNLHGNQNQATVHIQT
jgi:hypothetical protein